MRQTGVRVMRACCARTTRFSHTSHGCFLCKTQTLLPRATPSLQAPKHLGVRCSSPRTRYHNDKVSWIQHRGHHSPSSLLSCASHTHTDLRRLEHQWQVLVFLQDSHPKRRPCKYMPRPKRTRAQRSQHARHSFSKACLRTDAPTGGTKVMVAVQGIAKRHGASTNGST